MKRLLIVDGSNLLFQMFFGMPARIINKDGKAIQGTLGFVGALLKIIRKVLPTHTVVLFDSECENQRCELDPSYKANRPDYSEVADGDNPFSQLPDIYRALDCLGIRHTEITVGETDDVVASYALGREPDCEIIISSFDSDFFQLINDSVFVLRYHGDNTVICTPDYIREKFGIEPCKYADHKALVGDSADNIRGADKIGPKTATQLIREFGSLEEIITGAENIKKPSVRASIQKDADRLRRNLKLIKLSGSAPIPFALPELEYHCTGMTTTEVLIAIGLK